MCCVWWYLQLRVIIYDCVNLCIKHLLLTDHQGEQRIRPIRHPSELQIDLRSANPEKHKKYTNSLVPKLVHVQFQVQLFSTMYLMGVLVSNVTFFGDDIHVIFVSNIHNS